MEGGWTAAEQAFSLTVSASALKVTSARYFCKLLVNFFQLHLKLQSYPHQESKSLKVCLGQIHS